MPMNPRCRQRSASRRPVTWWKLSFAALLMGQRSRSSWRGIQFANLSDWRLYGQEAEAKIFEKLGKRCQKRNASLQTRQGQERPRWQRRQGEESQAGHRDWTLQGSQEGKESPQEEVLKFAF